MKLASIVASGLAAIALAPFGRADFTFEDFASVRGLNLVDECAQVGSVLRLTPTLTYTKGAAWCVDQQDVKGGFETVFDFQLNDPLGPGADGFAFVIQDESPAAIGSWGGFLGYSSGYGDGYVVCGDPIGITESLVIEFDTWYNPDFEDPNSNHISVHTQGAAPNCAHEMFSLGSTTRIPDMRDGAVHTVRIRYYPGLLEVFLDDLVAPALTVQVKLDDLLRLERAWVGFTAGTGSVWQNHDILRWKFVELATDE